MWTSNATDLALKGVLSLQMKISAALTRSCYYVAIVLMLHSNGNPGICWWHPVLQWVEIIIQFDDHCLSHMTHLLLRDLVFSTIGWFCQVKYPTCSGFHSSLAPVHLGLCPVSLGFWGQFQVCNKKKSLLWNKHLPLKLLFIPHFVHALTHTDPSSSIHIAQNWNFSSS